MAGITLPPESSPTPGNSSARTQGSARPQTGDSLVAPQTLRESAPESGASAVQVSPLARQAAAIEAGIERSPALDSDKVAALRQAISEGSYQVDSARLATAIMSLEQGL